MAQQFVHFARTSTGFRSLELGEGKINFSQLCSNTSKVKEAVRSETMEGVRGMSGKVNKYVYQICVKKTCPKEP